MTPPSSTTATWTADVSESLKWAADLPQPNSIANTASRWPSSLARVAVVDDTETRPVDDLTSPAPRAVAALDRPGPLRPGGATFLRIAA
jgi:hypothetical protein